MAPTLQDLGIDQLNVDDRLALVDAIWESIAAAPDALPLSDAQKELLDRRIEELDANPQDVLTWEQIKAHVRGRT